MHSSYSADSQQCFEVNTGPLVKNIPICQLLYHHLPHKSIHVKSISKYTTTQNTTTYSHHFIHQTGLITVIFLEKLCRWEIAYFRLRLMAFLQREMQQALITEKKQN